MKTVNKLKSKNLNHAHISHDGKVTLFYSKYDKESDSVIEWDEIADFKLKPFVKKKSEEEFSFSHIYIKSRAIGLLRYIDRISIWPYLSPTKPEINIRTETISLWLSDDKTELTFDSHFINEEKYPFSQPNIVIVK